MTRTFKLVKADRRQGSALVDLIIGSLISLIIATGVLTLFSAQISSQAVVVNQNTATQWSANPMDTITDIVRKALPYGIVGGRSVISAGTSNSITIYTDSASGATLKLWLDNSTTPANLKQTIGASVTTVAKSVTSLTFTYYVSGGLYNASSASWVTTTNPNAPTSAELKYVAAVKVSATATVSGISRTLVNVIRFRNGPTDSL